MFKYFGGWVCVCVCVLINCFLLQVHSKYKFILWRVQYENDDALPRFESPIFPFKEKPKKLSTLWLRIRIFSLCHL